MTAVSLTCQSHGIELLGQPASRKQSAHPIGRVGLDLRLVSCARRVLCRRRYGLGASRHHDFSARHRRREADAPWFSVRSGLQSEDPEVVGQVYKVVNDEASGRVILIPKLLRLAIPSPGTR